MTSVFIASRFNHPPTPTPSFCLMLACRRFVEPDTMSTPTSQRTLTTAFWKRAVKWTETRPVDEKKKRRKLAAHLLLM